MRHIQERLRGREPRGERVIVVLDLENLEFETETEGYYIGGYGGSPVAREEIASPVIGTAGAGRGTGSSHP